MSTGTSSEIRTQSAPSKASMLKTSWSIEVESSTTTTTSVCGLKYVPGRTSRSSSSTIRFSSSATARRLVRGATRQTWPEFRYWPRFSSSRSWRVDLGLDVERLLALASAALVAGDDELADLLAQRGVVGGGRLGPGALLGEQPLELGIDVERGLAASALAVCLRLEHLAQLVLLDSRRLGLGAESRIPCGMSDSNSTESPPLPIDLNALPALAMKAIAATGIATRTTIRITSPLETAGARDEARTATPQD